MSTFNIWASVPFRSSFFHHLFNPPRPTGPRNFKVRCLIPALSFATVFSSMYVLTAQGLSFWLSLSFLKFINILVLIPIFPFFLKKQSRLKFTLSLKTHTLQKIPLTTRTWSHFSYIYISLDNIDILCLHIFVYILLLYYLYWCVAVASILKFGSISINNKCSVLTK